MDGVIPPAFLLFPYWVLFKAVRLFVTVRSRRGAGLHLFVADEREARGRHPFAPSGRWRAQEED